MNIVEISGSIATEVSKHSDDYHMSLGEALLGITASVAFAGAVVFGGLALANKLLTREPEISQGSVEDL